MKAETLPTVHETALMEEFQFWVMAVQRAVCWAAAKEAVLYPGTIMLKSSCRKKRKYSHLYDAKENIVRKKLCLHRGS